MNHDISIFTLVHVQVSRAPEHIQLHLHFAYFVFVIIELFNVKNESNQKEFHIVSNHES